MPDKILGIVCFALAAASQAFIKHGDTANFYSLLFFALGAYEFILGDIRLRNLLSSRPNQATAQTEQR